MATRSTALFVTLTTQLLAAASALAVEAEPTAAQKEFFTKKIAPVLAESCLIAAAGGLPGLGAAWLLAAGGSPVPAMLPVFYLPLRYVLIGAGLVFALGLVAGILPALQAMRLQVAAALGRHA